MRCLILSFSELDRDPRVLRQVEWLKSEGYEVDFVGFGNPSGLGLRRFHLVPVSKIAFRFFAYLLPNRLRFQALYGRFLPGMANELVAQTDLLVINEPELIPALIGASINVPVYLDLHENHIDSAHEGFLERLAFKRYWEWQTQKLLEFVSRNKTSIAISTVESAIASVYADSFGLPVRVIYNSPKTAQEFGPLVQSDGQLNLVHLGMARKNRGIELILKALSRVNRPVKLDLLLVFAPVIPFFRWKIERMILSLGLSERVQIRLPVKVTDVVEALTEYDISLVIGSNATNNDLNSLPNKFFQSVQAGLMIICGPNPAVRRLVEEGQLGWVLDDWDAELLAQVLEELDQHSVKGYKLNSRTFAAGVSEAFSRSIFLEILQELGLGEVNRGK